MFPLVTMVTLVPRRQLDCLPQRQPSFQPAAPQHYHQLLQPKNLKLYCILVSMLRLL